MFKPRSVIRNGSKTLNKEIKKDNLEVAGVLIGDPVQTNIRQGLAIQEEAKTTVFVSNDSEPSQSLLQNASVNTVQRNSALSSEVVVNNSISNILKDADVVNISTEVIISSNSTNQKRKLDSIVPECESKYNKTNSNEQKELQLREYLLKKCLMERSARKRSLSDHILPSQSLEESNSSCNDEKKSNIVSSTVKMEINDDLLSINKPIVTLNPVATEKSNSHIVNSIPETIEENMKNEDKSNSFVTESNVGTSPSPIEPSSTLASTKVPTPQDELLVKKRELEKVAENIALQLQSLASRQPPHTSTSSVITTKDESNSNTDSKTPPPPSQNTEGKTEGDEGNCDDEEGYYRGKPSELIGGHYRLMNFLGKGVFASVVRCMHVRSSKLVAIKVTRTSPGMVASGERELEILRHLGNTDSEDRKHVIRLAGEGAFQWKGHLCIVLENMNTNLRKFCSQHANGKGLSVHIIRLYAKQLFIALKHIHYLGYIHADIKPDNIVLSDNLNTVKLCDFGSVIRLAESKSFETNSYLAARFYRSPEVVLCYGEKSCSLDIWALSVTLLELFKGSLVFTGESNSELLWSVMTTLGPIPRKMIKGARCKKYFEETGHEGKMFVFLRKDVDKHSGREAVRKLDFSSLPSSSSDLQSILSSKKQADRVNTLSTLVLYDSGRSTGASSLNNLGGNVTTKEQLVMFRELISKGLVYDPNKRLTAANALTDAFFRDPFGCS